MTDGWHWYASSDDEYFQIGPCASRDEVLAQARSEDLGLRQGPEGNWDRLTFFLVEARQDPIDLSRHFDVEYAIVRMMERADDEHGDDSRYPTENAWSDKQNQELEALLTQTVADWQARNAIVVKPYLFTDTRNREAIDLRVPLPVT